MLRLFGSLTPQNFASTVLTFFGAMAPRIVRTLTPRNLES